MKLVMLIIVIASACIYYNIKVDVKFDKNNPHFQKTISDLQQGLETLKK